MKKENAIGLDDSIFQEIKLQIISLVTDKDFKNFKTALMQISQAEYTLEEIATEHKLSKQQRKIFRFIFLEHIHTHFKSVDVFYSTINTLFAKFSDELAISDFEERFGVKISYETRDVEKNNNSEIIDKVKFIESIALAEFKTFVNDQTSWDYIPSILIDTQIKLLNRKIREFVKINYEVPFHKLKEESTEEYKFFAVYFRKFIDGKVSLFDENITTSDNKLRLFSLFCLSVGNITTEKQNNALFWQLFKELMIMMDVKAIDLYRDKAEKILEGNDNCEEELNWIKEADRQVIWVFIFNLSLILNSLIIIGTNSEEKRESLFNPSLLCSARKRNFLETFLKQITLWSLESQLIAEELNDLLESSIYVDLVESYALNLFDEDRSRKISITNKEIEQMLADSDNPLKQLICNRIKVIENSYDTLSVGNRLKSAFNFVSNFVRSSKVVQTIKLEFLPLNPVKVSTKVILFIDEGWKHISLFGDYYLVKIDLEQSKFNEIENFVTNIISKDNNERKKMAEKRKKTTSLVGKYLANLLASRAIFKFQTISFVAAGEGCNVVKNCLKELHRFAGRSADLKDLVQNVVFMSGATNLENLEKYNKVFEIVSGRKINLYSGKNVDLTMDYFVNINKLPIGCSTVRIDDFENICFDDYLERDYKEKINYVLGSLRVFN